MKYLGLFFMISFTNIILSPPKVDENDDELVAKCKIELIKENFRFNQDLSPNESDESKHKKWAKHFLKIEQIHNLYGHDIITKAQTEIIDSQSNKKE